MRKYNFEFSSESSSMWCMHFLIFLFYDICRCSVLLSFLILVIRKREGTIIFTSLLFYLKMCGFLTEIFRIISWFFTYFFNFCVIFFLSFWTTKFIMSCSKSLMGFLRETQRPHLIFFKSLWTVNHQKNRCSQYVLLLLVPSSMFSPPIFTFFSPILFFVLARKLIITHSCFQCIYFTFFFLHFKILRLKIRKL